MDWFNNPWVVGIGGSALSSLLITGASRAFLKKRKKREYSARVRSANAEIISAMHSSMIHGQKASLRVLRAIINSSARRYHVSPNDLYTPAEVSEELIKDAMDSRFLSEAQKAEHCARLTAMVGSRRKAPASKE